MAKISKNAEKFPIQWNGKIDSPFFGADNNEVPDSESIIWGNNEYTWGDVQFVQEIVDGVGTGRRRQDRLNKILDDEDKKKRIIHLICRVKGEKVFDEDIEVKDVQVNIKDVDMITERILGKVTMETEDVL